MNEFVKTNQDINELLKFWKAGLQLQESMEMKISPVNSRVASIEGRPYCKIPFNENTEGFNHFLIRLQKSFEFQIQQDELPFLSWVHEADKKRKRFNVEYDQPFQVGFPTIYYQDQFNRERLTTIFKFNIHHLDYPSQKSLKSSQELEDKHLSFNLTQDWPVDDESFPYWIDETFLVEELGLDPDLISEFRKEAVKNGFSPEGSLKIFIEFLAKEFCLEEQVKGDDLLADLVSVIQATFLINLGNNPRKKFGGYPYALLFALEVSRPTRQLQNDLDDLISQNLFRFLDDHHPAKLFLKGQHPESESSKYYPGLHHETELTKSQKEIVESMYGKKLSVVQGPPGTGKTHLIRSIIAHRIVQHALSLKSSEGSYVNARWVTMITSTNNQAVDHALQGLYTENLLPVNIRLGSWKKMQEYTLPLLEEMIMELGSRRPDAELERFETEKKTLDELNEKTADDTSATAQFRLYLQARIVQDAWVGSRQEQAINLLQKIINDIEDFRGMHGLKKKENIRMLFSMFPVLGSTLLSIRNFLPLKEELFGLLLVDEAGQCCPSYLLPAFVRSRRSMLIGDTMQLEPISHLRVQDWNKLARSRKIHLEEDTYLNYVGSAEFPRSSQHLAVDGTSKSMALKDHFRCRESIISICEQLCDYDLQVHEKTHPLLIEELDKSALWYLETHGSEARYGSSWCNGTEANFVIQTVKELLKRGVQTDQIALITPFRGQMKLLIKLLEKERIGWKSGENDQGKTRGGITIGTVHRFQGGEKNIVLFSPVIQDGIPKFLNTRVNLLNVAISRARDYFIFIGSLENLKLGEFTTVLHQNLIEKGLPLPLFNNVVTA